MYKSTPQVLSSVFGIKRYSYMYMEIYSRYNHKMLPMDMYSYSLILRAELLNSYNIFSPLLTFIHILRSLTYVLSVCSSSAMMNSFRRADLRFSSVSSLAVCCSFSSSAGSDCRSESFHSLVCCKNR